MAEERVKPVSNEGLNIRQLLRNAYPELTFSESLYDSIEREVERLREEIKLREMKKVARPAIRIDSCFQNEDGEMSWNIDVYWSMAGVQNFRVLEVVSHGVELRLVQDALACEECLITLENMGIPGQKHTRADKMHLFPVPVKSA